jgi:hypothetical protein
LAGKFSAEEGASSAATCSDCAVGTFSSEGSSGCTKCEPGTVAPALGMAACESCEAGKFAAFPGSAYCTSCPTGKTSVAGSISEKDCNLDSASTVTIVMTKTVEMEVFLLISEPDFDEEKQQVFKEAIAEAAGHGVRADHVIISKIEEMSMAARRLFSQGIRIAVIVNAEDRSAASAIAESLTEEAINNELQQVGLPHATILVAAAVTEDSEPEVAGDVPVAAIGGGAAAVALVVAIAGGSTSIHAHADIMLSPPSPLAYTPSPRTRNISLADVMGWVRCLSASLPLYLSAWVGQRLPAATCGSIRM